MSKVSGLGGLRLELQFEHRPKGKPLARILGSSGGLLMVFDAFATMTGQISHIQPTGDFIKELRKRIKTEPNSPQKKKPKSAPRPVKTRRKLKRVRPK